MDDQRTDREGGVEPPHDEARFGIYLAFAVLFVGGSVLSERFAGNPSWGSLALPAYGAFRLIAQLRSGMAVDALGRERYPKGTPRYSKQLVFLVAWTLLASALAVVDIYSFNFAPTKNISNPAR
jgi:hypothetical protein